MTTQELTTPEGMARVLLAFFSEDGSNWTQHVYARDARGVACDLTDQSACRLCAWGALYRLTGTDNNVEQLPPDVREAAFALAERTGHGTLTALNDSRTYEGFRHLLSRVAGGAHLSAYTP
jgi:hypothetical protein